MNGNNMDNRVLGAIVVLVIVLLVGALVLGGPDVFCAIWGHETDCPIQVQGGS